jgi:Flp pilus assembly pilin Flp
MSFRGRDRVHALSVLFQSLIRHRGATTAIEYALIAALLSVTIVPQAASAGKQLLGLMNNISTYLAGVPPTEPDPPLP